MFDFLHKYKTTLIGVTLIVGAFIVYQFYYVDGKKDSVLISQSGSEISGSVVGREIVVLLDELQAINLDSSILDDPAFQSLIDFEQEVQEEPIGRSNPFIPVGSE